MNKVIDTKERVFMSLVGPSGCGKTRLIFEMLKRKVFKPMYEKIYYFYQHNQQVFRDQARVFKNIEFINGVDFEMINSLPFGNNERYLLIFDDSCEEICRSKEFQMLATAGRHRGLNVIYIKHNLFHKSPLGRDIELQLTHIILFKNPRDVQQIKHLGRQLGLGNELDDWYKDATREPYGFLMIDLCPKTNENLRYSSGFNPTVFFLPKRRSRVTFIDDVYTRSLYPMHNFKVTKTNANSSN
jgi:hypothetical protein